MRIPHHYIVTIHNAGSVLRDVLAGVVKNIGDGGVIVPVLDGCVDSSEEIVKEFMRDSGKNIQPVYTADVHEIGAINAALAILPPGHVFILQDDVVLTDSTIETFFETELLPKYPDVGYVSMRMGGDIYCTTRMKLAWHFVRSRFRIKSRLLDVKNLTHSIFDKSSDKVQDILSTWEIKVVSAGIKSPAWMSNSLREVVPLLDRNLMPFCYDDMDMSIESLKHGFYNLLVAVPYLSEKEWGGTRKPNSSFSRLVNTVPVRNRGYLFKKHYFWLRSSSIIKKDGLLGSWLR